MIVDESAWEEKEDKISQNKLTQIRVGYEETDLREKITTKGGKWNKQKKVWQIWYGDVVDLELTERIVQIKNV